MDLRQSQKFLRMPDRVSQIIVNGDQADYEHFLEYARTVEAQVKQARLPIVVRDYTELVEMFATVKGAFMLVTYTVSAILFIIVGGGIANAMFMAVRERRKEIGTLKAIGMEPSQVRILFLLEGIVVGLLGAILGVLLSFWVIHLINAQGGASVFPGQPFRLKPLIDWVIVNLSFVMAFLISLLASWLPASASAKLDPVQALTEA
jgi:putative ABC transport system permease protein